MGVTTIEGIDFLTWESGNPESQPEDTWSVTGNGARQMVIRQWKPLNGFEVRFGPIATITKQLDGNWKWTTRRWHNEPVGEGTATSLALAMCAATEAAYQCQWEDLQASYESVAHAFRIAEEQFAAASRRIRRAEEAITIAQPPASEDARLKRALAPIQSALAVRYEAAIVNISTQSPYTFGTIEELKEAASGLQEADADLGVFVIRPALSWQLPIHGGETWLSSLISSD